MDLDALRTFAAVAGKGGLTQAARELCVSVPAASARIKALEEEAGFALFDRAPTGMRLTPRGQAFLETAKDLLGQADRLRRTARSLATGRSALRLAVISQADLTRVAALSAYLLTKHPDLDVSFHTALSGDIWRQAEEGAVSAGLALDLRGAGGFAGLEFRPLAFIPHALIGPPDADPGQGLASFPFLATPPACSLNAAAALFFAAQGLPVPKPRAVADNEALLVDMAARGLGLAMTRLGTAQAAASSGRVRLWPVPPVELALGRVRRAGPPAPELTFLDEALDVLWPAAPTDRARGPARRPSEESPCSCPQATPSSSSARS